LSSLGVALLVATGFAVARAQDQGQPNVELKVREIASRMDRGGLDSVWDRAADLEKLGSEAAPIMAKRLDDPSPIVRLGISKALLSIDGADPQREAAMGAVKSLLMGDAARDLRVSAAELLTLHGHKEEVKALDRDVDAIHDPFVKLAVLKALKTRGHVRNAVDRMKEFLASDDFSVRAEAAIRLGECLEFEASKEVLEQLKLEPSERGLRAKALLEQAEQLKQLEKTGGLDDKDAIVKLKDKKINELEEELDKARHEKGGSGGGPGSALLRELEERISGSYVDEKKSKIDVLTEAAAKGMVDSLDPFSSYMTEKETNAFNESIKQHYAGIGAVVQMDRKTGYLTIVRPIYGGPAYRAGLRSLDQIQEILPDEKGTWESTKDKQVTDLVGKLKGEPGTKVHIKVKSFLAGPDAPLSELAISRRGISLPSIRYDLLPGKIGYLQLEQFGANAGQEVEDALLELEKKGMRALVFDLRGNPGGLLNQAVEVCSKFLAKGKLVVYQKGRDHTDVGKRRDFYVQSDEAHPDYPLLLLVDENSASASEIVSGCLQVHKRADLVGQQTFGKGSVQQIYPVDATDNKSALRLTIAYYYLPDGRCIHRPRNVKTWRFRETIRMEIERWKQEGQISEAQAKILLDQYKLPPGGIVPDFSVETEHFTAAVQKQMADVLDSLKLEAYVQKEWPKNKDVLHELARWDNFDTSKYPDFDQLYTDLKTELSKEDVRKLLRMTIRRFTQDDLEKVLPSDFQEDQQLDAAVFLACQKTGTDPAAVGELQFIAKKFPKGIERNAQVASEKKGPPESGDDEGDDETPAPPKKPEPPKPEKKKDAPEKKDDKSDPHEKDF
jgi:carboxyl-terminal processing protease